MCFFSFLSFFFFCLFVCFSWSLRGCRVQLNTLLPLFPTDSSDACFLLLFPHGSSWIATQLMTMVGFYRSSKPFMCIREKGLGTLCLFSLHGRTNAMRSQGEVTKVLNVPQNWLASHSCSFSHIVISNSKGKEQQSSCINMQISWLQNYKC